MKNEENGGAYLLSSSLGLISRVGMLVEQNKEINN